MSCPGTVSMLHAAHYRIICLLLCQLGLLMPTACMSQFYSYQYELGVYWNHPLSWLLVSDSSQLQLCVHFFHSTPGLVVIWAEIVLYKCRSYITWQQSSCSPCQSSVFCWFHRPCLFLFICVNMCAQHVFCVIQCNPNSLFTTSKFTHSGHASMTLHPSARM